MERASQSAEVRLWIPGMYCKPGAQRCNGGPNEGGTDIAFTQKKFHKTNLKDALVPSQSVIEGCQGECHGLYPSKTFIIYHNFNLKLFVIFWFTLLL